MICNNNNFIISEKVLKIKKKYISCSVTKLNIVLLRLKNALKKLWSFT